MRAEPYSKYKREHDFDLRESCLVQKPLQCYAHSSCSNVPVEQHLPLGLLPNLGGQLLLEEEASQAEHILLLTGTALLALAKEGPVSRLEVL